MRVLEHLECEQKNYCHGREQQHENSVNDEPGQPVRKI